MNGMDRKTEKNEDFYLDADGFTVMTAHYLLKRGYCCGNGCRHCPYDFEAVPEPSKSYFIEMRAKSTKPDGTCS